MKWISPFANANIPDTMPLWWRLWTWQICHNFWRNRPMCKTAPPLLIFQRLMRKTQKLRLNLTMSVSAILLSSKRKAWKESVSRWSEEPQLPLLAQVSAILATELSCKFIFNQAKPTLSMSVCKAGAGKTTISRLFFRFYDVKRGAVKINGVDVRSISQAQLRQAIGVVPQAAW